MNRPPRPLIFAALAPLAGTLVVLTQVGHSPRMKAIAVLVGCLSLVPLGTFLVTDHRGSASSLASHGRNMLAGDEPWKPVADWPVWVARLFGFVILLGVLLTAAAAIVAL